MPKKQGVGKGSIKERNRKKVMKICGKERGTEMEGGQKVDDFRERKEREKKIK